MLPTSPCTGQGGGDHRGHSVLKCIKGSTVLSCLFFAGHSLWQACLSEHISVRKIPSFSLCWCFLVFLQLDRDGPAMQASCDFPFLLAAFRAPSEQWRRASEGQGHPK